MVCGLLVIYIQYERTKVVSKNVDNVVEEALTEKEITSVNDAIVLNNEVLKLETYINENPYMSINALDYKQLSMIIIIRAEAGVDARDIASLYVSNIYSNEFADKIIDYVDEGASASEFTSLLSANSVKTNAYVDTSVENSDLVKVNIMIPDSWNQDILQEAMQSVAEEIEIEKYSSDYTSSIEYIDIKDCSSLDIQDKQNSVLNSLATMKTQLKAYTDAFTDNQNKLYDGLLSGKTIDSVDFSTEMIVPKMSPKYFAVGFFIGIFVYAIIYALIVCFDKKCHIEVYENIKLLTVINISEKTGVKGFLFEDRFLKRLLFKRESNLKCQMKSFVQKIKVILKGQDGKTVYILASKRIIDKLEFSMVGTLNNFNIKICEAESTNDLDSFLHMIQADEAYVVVTEDSITERYVLSDLQSMAIANGIHFLGQIIVL